MRKFFINVFFFFSPFATEVGIKKFSVCLDASVNKAIFKKKSDSQPLPILPVVQELLIPPL